MQIALELVANGLLLGGVYALLACGLNLIFGVMHVINLAHGEFLAIGALAAVSIVVTFGLPFWVAVLLVPLVVALAGLVLQKTLIRRVLGDTLVMSLLLTYALSTILLNIALLVWGGAFRAMPGVLAGSIPVAGIYLSQSRLVAFAVALAVSLGVYAFLRFASLGKAIRAASQAPEIAVAVGIDVDRVRNIAFALGAGMAGLAGVLIAPIFASDPQMGARFVIKAFAVVIVGGMGSYTGALWAALLLGVVEVVGGYLIGQIFGTALLYLMMLLVLLVRPQGLLAGRARA